MAVVAFALGLFLSPAGCFGVLKTGRTKTDDLVFSLVKALNTGEVLPVAFVLNMDERVQWTSWRRVLWNVMPESDWKEIKRRNR